MSECESAALAELSLLYLHTILFGKKKAGALLPHSESVTLLFRMIARNNGWAEFVSIQNHYNLIYREEEREMIQLLEEEKMVMTPYSPIAAGRLCRLYTDEKTTRSSKDPVNERKYDHARNKP